MSLQSKKFIRIVLTLLIGMSSVSYSSSRYLLCGPDEDGCPDDGYEYCSCIAYNDSKGSLPYCFDFDNLKCIPLDEKPDCDPNLIYNNQSNCVAMIFHSTALPGCMPVTKAFCTDHHIKTCNENGNPSSCR